MWGRLKGAKTISTNETWQLCRWLPVKFFLWCSSLIDYSLSMRNLEAPRCFELLDRDVLSWSAMIHEIVKSGKVKHYWTFLNKCNIKVCSLIHVAFVGLLNACANVAGGKCVNWKQFWVWCFVVALSTCMLNVEELMKLGESSRGCPQTTWYLRMPHWHLCKMWEIGLWFANVEQDVHTHICGIREKSSQQLEVRWQWVQSLPYEGHSQKCQNVTLIQAQGSIFDYHDWRTCAISTSQGIGNCNMMAWARLCHLCGLAKTNVPV
jgi:hypothetical protein